MAKRSVAITVKVTHAWWLRWYLLGVVLTARVTGLRPNEEKLRYWIAKGVRVKLVRASHAPPQRMPPPIA